MLDTNRIYNLFRTVLLAALLLAGAVQVDAQQYPVNVQVQLLQPVSAQLSNLYSGTQPRMILTLLNTDIQKPTLSVRLRFYIKGSSATLRNKTYGQYPTIDLDAGIPVQLSLSDLAPYFAAANLDATGISPSQLIQNARLPDGYYTFCVEAVEINSGQVVSNSQLGCSPPTWISTSLPPLLNLPLKAEAVAFREPLNLTFNWTPRHMSSANAAFQTEYEFTIAELWDTGILPEAAFANTMPLYQETTTATTFLYGPAQPPLMPGKRYGWRIRAKAKVGVDEFDVFQNNGYSEVFYFNLQEDCQPPTQVVNTIENGKVTIAWAPQPKMYEYLIEYREEGNATAEWFNIKTTDDHATIYDAVPGKRYEYRVGGYCTQGNKTLGDLHGFEMPARDTSRNKQCGIIPDIKLENQTPIQELQNGDQIMAGDFPVRLMTVRGTGSFTGSGYVMIPFLSDAKVKVTFTNITVNTSRQLLTGYILTTFDSTAAQVVKVGDVIKAFTDLASVIYDLGNLSIDADYIVVKELTEAIKKMAENELPEDLKERMVTAADKLESTKQAYDEAKKEYDAATTDEEKKAAKEKMQEAKEAFEAAKDEMKAVNKEKEELVKTVTELLVKAVKSLKAQYDEVKRKAVNDKATSSAKELDDLIAAVKKTLTNGVEVAASEEVPADAVVLSDISSDETDDSEFGTLSIAYKKAEAEQNKVTAIDILDRDISNKQYYSLISEVFKVNGKNLIDYINEERKAGTTDDAIVASLREKLDTLLTDLLK